MANSVRSTARLLAPLLCVLSIGCSTRAPEADARANVVLISIDTLRADHLGCYGYERATSPNVDAFCRESVVFEKAFAHAPSTLPSHASILTSLVPHHHGASWENKRALPDASTTLSEVLAEAGYSTAAFTGGGQLDPLFGLTQGFDAYEVLAADDFEATVDRTLEWLDEGGKEPFFLFLHTYQVHHPYDPAPERLAELGHEYDGPLSNAISVETIKAINASEEELGEEELAHIIATYDAEIREVDVAVGRLVAELEARGLWDEALVVFTSDHGEEFGEHGFVGWHSHSLYEELLSVPLVVKFPAGAEAGRRVDAVVRSIDIAPTVLKALGLRSPSQFSGIDLAALWSDRQVPTLPVLSRLDRVDKARVSAIREGSFKLLRPFSRKQHLFDLDEDPGELWDDSSNHPDEVGRLLRLFEELLATRETPTGTEVNPSAKLVQELRDLGYID